MAIYMCSVKVIKRSEGKSIVAAAAYRSGEEIENQWDGITHNYTNKHYIEHTEIMLPDHAPCEYQSRSKLWNAVEMSEKSSTARLGKEVLLALPREMSLSEQVALVKDYVKRTFVDDGMCADIAIHNPPLRNDLGQPIDYNNHLLTDPSQYIYPNPHAHILLTIRPISQSGKWEQKSSIEYICKLNGKEKAFTADEYKIYKSQGWEKQYKYIDGNKKRWLTTAEGSQLGLTRAGKNPKTSTHGRANPTVFRWESPKTIYHWRKSWEEIANEHLRKNGYTERIDSRSYIAQGKHDYIPSIHLGSQVTNMIRRENRIYNNCIPSENLPEIAKIQAEIKMHNKLVKELTAEINILTEKINQLTNEADNKIEQLKKLLTQKQKEKSDLDKRILENKYKLSKLQQSITLINDTAAKIKSANDASYEKINNYKSELSSLSFFDRKKKADLNNKIDQEIKNIDSRNQYLSTVLGNCNLTSMHDITKLVNEYSDADAEAKKLNDQVATCIEQIAKTAFEYTKLVASVVETKGNFQNPTKHAKSR